VRAAPLATRFQYAQDRFSHTGCIAQNLIIPEPQHTPTALREPCGPSLIIFAVGMLASVRLDDQPVLDADEVEDEAAFGVLTANL
jgi:hypothetical protein